MGLLQFYLTVALAIFCCGLTTTVADPPMVAPDPHSKESSAEVLRSSKGDTYTVTFAHVSHIVTGDDFSAKLIGNNVLRVKVANTNLDWFFNLVQVKRKTEIYKFMETSAATGLQSVPKKVKLTPPIEIERLPGDDTGAVWKVSVLIPRFFFGKQKRPLVAVAPSVGGEAILSPSAGAPIAQAPGMLTSGAAAASRAEAAARPPPVEVPSVAQEKVERPIQRHLPKPVKGKYPPPLFDN